MRELKGRRPSLRVRVAALLIPATSLLAVSYFALWGCADGRCWTGADCDSGHCWGADAFDVGFCCDTPCDGACEGCQGGTCAPNETAPLDVCGGFCDGVEGAETFPDSTVQCRPASCSVAGTEHTATLEAFCDGQGHCPPEQTQACAPLICGATTCEGGCTTEADCSASEVCAAGVCVAKQPLGAACGVGTQCESGFCTATFDQTFVCCDAECAGPCELCDGDGICTPIESSFFNKCQLCDGENGASISFAPFGTPCGNSCTADAADSCVCRTGERDVCDGAGHCWAPPYLRCDSEESESESQSEGDGCSCGVVGGERR